MSKPHNGDHVERLLEEVEAVAGPTAWPRVEALVAALVDLYGDGLGRLLSCARTAAGDTAALDDLLAHDELVASLLLLHGLHPLPLEERIGRALRRVRAELPTAAELTLAGVEDGIVKLRVVEADGAASARPPPTTIVAREIEREAPEIAGVQIDSLAPAAKPASELVPIERLTRGGARS
jgi:hypothetical protein